MMEMGKIDIAKIEAARRGNGSRVGVKTIDDQRLSSRPFTAKVPPHATHAELEVAPTCRPKQCA